MDRITAIRLALRAFVCGIIGFLPVVGLIPAIYALILRGQIRSGFGAGWNPASRYATAGAVLAFLGLLSTFLLVVAIAFASVSH